MLLHTQISFNNLVVIALLTDWLTDLQLSLKLCPPLFPCQNNLRVQTNTPTTQQHSLLLRQKRAKRRRMKKTNNLRKKTYWSSQQHISFVYMPKLCINKIYKVTFITTIITTTTFSIRYYCCFSLCNYLFSSRKRPADMHD